MAGVVALVTLTAHGALYIAIKTEADLSRRARSAAIMLWPVMFFLTSLSLVMTYFIRPELMENYHRYPAGLLIPVTVVASLGLIIWAAPKGKDKLAFAGTTIYLVAMLVGAVFALYPVVLPASTGSAYSLTIYNSSAAHHGLVIGMVWWILGAVLAVCYFGFVFRMFRGKVSLDTTSTSSPV
jgi:cytochrome d ubiquinol oxidase subunit II